MNLVILTKNAGMISLTYNWFFMFKPHLWFLIIATIVAFKILKKILFAQCLLRRISIYPFNMLVVTYSIFVLIFASIFQSKIITALTKPIYLKNIDHIDELIQSGCTIYSEKTWDDFISNKLLNKLTYCDSYNTVREKISTLKDVGAFVITKGKEEFENDTLGTKQAYYHLMKESAGVAFLASYVPNNSPYKEIFKNALMTFHSFGLIPNPEELDVNKKQLYNNTKKINLGHLKIAFFVLLCGWQMATLVYFGEVFWYKFFSDKAKCH